MARARRWMCWILPALLLSGCASDPSDDGAAAPAPGDDGGEVVCSHGTAYRNATVDAEVVTGEGTFALALALPASPVTVCNFLRYVEEDFYDGTVFHRVCEGFVVQAGGWEDTTPDSQRDAHEPIRNEARANGLSNVVRSVGMARTADPHSATTHFFVNLKDNLHLDPGGVDEWGYAVFANVTEGWDVVEAIEATPTVPAVDGCPEGNPVPGFAVVIEDVRLL